MIKYLIPYTVSLAVFLAGMKTLPMGAVLFLILAGVAYFACRKYGQLAFVVAALVFAQTLSHQLVGPGPYTRHLIRGGLVFLLLLCACARLNNRIRYTLPYVGLFAYVVYMIIPSTFGWFPAISYLKILFFMTYVYGLLCCGYLAVTSPDGVLHLRMGVLSIAAFYIWGSAISYFFPSVGFSMQISKAAIYGISAAESLSNSVTLFSGLFFHSQTLGPVVAILTGLILCDMLFVEHKFTIGHIMAASPGPILMYMSRSRTALLTFAVLIFVGVYIAARDSSLPALVKRRVRFIAFGVAFCVLGLAVTLEVTRGTMSNWILKGVDVSMQGHTVTDITGSRLGKVDENLYDFRKNPYIGKGFQTHELHRALFQEGVINYFFAPVEKGVLPLMILGEGGVLGGVLFVAFIMHFIAGCTRKRMFAQVVLFAGFIAANMGEAMFFSPSAAGGDMWLIVIFGGLAVDVSADLRRLAMWNGQMTM